MNFSRLPSPTARLLLASGLLLAGPTALQADNGEVTAVSSKVSVDYVRTKMPDGSFVPEAYTFGQGGLSSFAHDDTIDKLHFLDVARTIAVPLAAQKYLPSKDPSHLKLLIMVYWGTTAGTSEGASSSVAYQNLAASQSVTLAQVVTLPNGKIVTTGAGGNPAKSAQSFDENAVFMLAVQNHMRDKADYDNARLLGYDTALDDARGLEFTALRFRQRDLVEEIEDSRYFVVLMAYDFQLLLKEKKHKLLWETRFSIREHRNDFGKELSAMAQSASRYFGQDSHGLVRKPLPEGHVEVGEPKFLEFEPEKK